MANNENYTVPGSRYDPEGSKIPLTPEMQKNPKWYDDNIDSYPDIGDELNTKDDLEREGYILPDSDKSKSSVTYNDAVLNNSFSEDAIRKTLSDFHSNSYYKLTSGNMDNVHFFKWEGNISDTINDYEYFSIKLPWNSFTVYPDRRNKFKLSQFYHKWLSVEEIANHREVFYFMILLFVNHEIFSNYEVWIEEQYVVLRFPYQKYYADKNYPVYIYKFDTLFSKRVKISRELCLNQWDWKVPISHLESETITNHEKIIVAFNKATSDNRGDNLEFLDIDYENGIIDISGISEFNKNMILTEYSEWIWMTLFIPKFFHEYTQLLPMDIIYRPYVPDLHNVDILKNSVPTRVKADMVGDINQSQNVLVDYNDFYLKGYDGWTFIARPIVLSDSGHEFEELYDLIQDEIDQFTLSTYNFSDHIYELKDYIETTTSPVNIDIYNKLIIIESDKDDLYDKYSNFLDNRLCPRYNDIEDLFEEFSNMINSIKEMNPNYEIPTEFFNIATHIDARMHQFFEMFYIGDIVRSVKNKLIWSKPNIDKDSTRYYRPVSANDFWILQYDSEKHVWRPTSKKIEHYYPDIYTINSNDNESEEANVIYKAFFFYSDTFNTRDLTYDVIDSTPQFDDQFELYSDKHGQVFDMFIHKFYWMGLEYVYPGLMLTGSKWELIEYIKDNPGYRRYNEIFIKTIEPHYKLGLATYLRSDDVNFPFDSAISKMKEAIKLKWHDYDRIHNYQMYLNNHWTPSYFDYIIRILDEVDVEWRNIYRQDLMFDIPNLRNSIQVVYNNIHNDIESFKLDLQGIIIKLENNGYSINQNLIDTLINQLKTLDKWVYELLIYIDNFDLPIVSLHEMNNILSQMKTFGDSIVEISGSTLLVQTDIIGADVVLYKLEYLLDAENIISDNLSNAIYELIISRQTVDLDLILRGCYDIVNDFNLYRTPWSYDLKDHRTSFIQSAWNLMNFKNAENIYGDTGVNTTLEFISVIKEEADKFKLAIEDFWRNNNYEFDDRLLSKFDIYYNTHEEITQAIPDYLSKRGNIDNLISSIQSILSKFDTSKFTEEESDYFNTVNELITDIKKESYYLNGNHDLTIYNYHSTLLMEITLWLEYMGVESNVFEPIRTLILTFNNRLESFRHYSDNDVDIIIQYLKTANDKFIPDPFYIDYMSTYSPTEVRLVENNIGLHYNANDQLFIDGLASYKIDSVDWLGDILEISNLSEYYNTYFKDPIVDDYYYTLTDKNGINKFLKCIESQREYIINDEIAVSTIARLLSFASDIYKQSRTINPHFNDDIRNTLKRFDACIDDWNKRLDNYGNNMTEGIKDTINSTIPILTPLKNVTNSFLIERDKISVAGLIGSYRKLLDDFKSANSSIEWVSPPVPIRAFITILELSYTDLFNYYDGGRAWSDETKLISIISTIQLRLDEIKFTLVRQPSDKDDNVLDVRAEIDNVESVILGIYFGINSIKPIQLEINNLRNDIFTLLTPLNHTEIQGDEWFKLDNIFIAELGEGYKVSDIVSSTHLNLLFQITRVDDNGSVLQIRPMGKYALHEKIWGYHKTNTLRGNGIGLSLDIHSVSVKNNGAGTTDDSFIPDPDQYRNQDLMKFKFQNIHDLDMNYEVFAGGIQVVDFEQRHEDNHYSEPRKLDVLYVNSNTVNNLKNSHLHIKPDQYFIYKIDAFVIKDPGMGFHVEQDVYLDADHYCLKLNVAKLVYHPYKGIEEFDLVNGKLIYERWDPGSVDCPTIPDHMNNIDDEFHVSNYDKLTQEGKPRPEAFGDEIRYDDLDNDERNKYFQFRHVDLPEDLYPLGKYIGNGDPDHHYYLGNRMDMLGDSYDRWLGIVDVEDLVHPQIADHKRQPPDQDINSEFQLIERIRIFDNGTIPPSADYEVPTYKDLPKNKSELPGIQINDTIAVTEDEKNKSHRCIYPVMAIDTIGNIYYDTETIADGKWNKFYIDWMDIDSYPDIPALSVQYPDIDWRNIKTYREAEEAIGMRLYPQVVKINPINKTSYIDKLTIDDISVFNWTLKIWENLHDETRWEIEVRDDPDNKDWGFKLTFLMDPDYDYDMKLYLNKTPEVQQRNQLLVKPALVDIYSSIIDEVVIPEQRIEVNTSRTTRIRKLFPYIQKEEYVCDNDNRELIFDFPPYMHYKNEIHPEDIIIYNKTTGVFEDQFDERDWEIQIKDDRRNESGIEKIKRIKDILIIKSGESYSNGKVYGWNSDFSICIFGEIKSNIASKGDITEFELIHCTNQPDNGMMEFMLYQQQSSADGGIVLIDFETIEIQQNDDKYIHNVTQPLAPIKNGFKLINKQEFPIPYEYEISIKKTTTNYLHIRPDWEVTPIFEIPNESYPADRFYILINNRRFPLVNCSTKRPTLEVKREPWGTSVQFLNLYKKWEHFEIRTLPYPTRSIYVQRKIPSHGYINLYGKINKPLDKKHYEFWVNGKLLYDEVNIITPTKIFLHGLTSLKNLEILEINRSYNEYFSDDLLECYIDEDNPVPIPQWNLRTYLDDVLEGILPDNNYTLTEQEKLIAPVWKQVLRDHLDYKDYPENIDSERDILLRVYSPEDLPLPELPGGSYQYLIIDAPTIEGYTLDHRNLRWEGTGFKPIKLQTIVNVIAEEYEQEIREDPYFDPPVIITNQIWYGVTTKMYDEYGILTHELNDTCYKITDDNILTVDLEDKNIFLRNKITD